MSVSSFCQDLFNWIAIMNKSQIINEKTLLGIALILTMILMHKPQLKVPLKGLQLKQWQVGKIIPQTI